MKTKIILLFLSVLFIIPHFAEAQIFERTLNRAHRKVIEAGERKIDKKIDEVIERKLSEAGEAAKAKYGVVEESVDKEYNFNQVVVYELYELNKKGKKKDPNQMNLWLAEDNYVGMSPDEDNTSFVIMDESKLITVLVESKSYSVFDLNKSSMGETIATEENEESSVSIEKIGSEKILGYSCDIYRINSEDSEAKVWIAPGLKFVDFSKSFTTFPQGRYVQTEMPTSGLLLKMESKQSGQKETQVMEAISIDKEMKAFNMADYKNVFSMY